MTNRNALLWEVHSNKVFKGYIFGTMHVSVDIAFSDLSYLRSAIESCEVFAPEIPLHVAAQEEMGQHLYLPESISMQNLLSSRTYNKYQKILNKSFGLNLDSFDRIMPLFLLNFMTQIALKSSMEDPSNTMDYQFWSYAESKEKKLASMESIEDHIATLDHIPLSYQLSALKATLSNVSKFRSKTKQLLELYKNEEIHKLYKLSKKSIGSIKDVLLYDRNSKMAQNFINLSSENSVFAAIGAAHLSGKKGLLHLLTTHGYKVKPVRLN